MEILIYGITSFSSQIILIRESITTFSVGDILIPFIISIWLITTSVSSYISKKFIKVKYSEIKKVYHTISPFIIALQVLTIKSKNLFTPFGEELNIFWSFIITFFTITQYTIISGLYFQKASEENEKLIIKKIYLLDSVGFIISSVLFYIFSEKLKIIQIFLINYILNAIILIRTKSFSYKNLIILIISILIIDNTYKINPISKELFKYYNTKYGKIEIYKTKDNIYTYYNSQRILDTSDKDIIDRAAISCLLFSKKRENSICYSNNIYLCQRVAEMLNKDIYYIHQDKTLIDIQEKIYGEFKKLKKINNSIIKYLFSNNKKIDLIIINSSLPSTIAETSLFSKYFLKLIAKNLNEEYGVYVNIIPFPKIPDKYQKQALSFYITMLNDIFNNVEVFYDEFLVIVSSQKKVKPNYEIKGFEYYVRYLLENNLNIEKNLEVNIFSIYKMTLLSDIYKLNSEILEIILKISKFKNFIFTTFLILLIICLEKKLLSMFFASFSSLFAQYSIMVIYQIEYGYLYKDITLILLSSMIGIYLGINTKMKLNHLLYSLIILLIALLPFLIINKHILLLSISTLSFISAKIFRETSKEKGLMSYIFDCFGSFLSIVVFKIWIFQIQDIKYILLPIVITSIIFFIKK